MAKPIFEHSEEWIEKLTVPRQELSPDEQETLAAHIDSCPDCSRILAENAKVDQLIQELPMSDIPSGLSPKLLQLWQEEVRKTDEQQAQGRILICRDCGKEFLVGAANYEWHEREGLPQESRCPNCRIGRHNALSGSAAQQAAHDMPTVKCTECGAVTRVPFMHRSGHLVYCDNCYAKDRARRSSKG